ncbi:hypothetical protein LC612_33600 [Nostoc sp. CHAB 5834]|nr:hypothetical protein [Nostoc sp. CHAB 5834]
MPENDNTKQLLWVEIGASDKPELKEESFIGTLEEAIAKMQTRASLAGFLLGQVLRSDSKVLANIAHGAAAKTNEA